MQRAASTLVDAEHDIFRQVSIFVDEEHDSFSRMGFTICDRRTLTIEACDMSMRLPIPEGGQLHVVPCAVETTAMKIYLYSMLIQNTFMHYKGCKTTQSPRAFVV